MKTHEKMDFEHVQINLDQECQSILNKIHFIETTYCFLTHVFFFYSFILTKLWEDHQHVIHPMSY